jgi:hypothetical protein
MTRQEAAQLLFLNNFVHTRNSHFRIVPLVIDAFEEWDKMLAHPSTKRKMVEAGLLDDIQED